MAVIDTPDWFNSEQTPDEVRAQISSCVALSSPGPHTFLLCVPADQPAKTELQALRALEFVFGPESVQKHTLVLFTHADRLLQSGKLGSGGVEAYIAAQRGDLLKIVEKCGDRFHVTSREGARERRNVAELLEKVEQIVKEADGRCYSSPAFQEAEERVRQRQVELTRERRTLEDESAGAGGRRGAERPVLYPSMPSVLEVTEEELEETRDEAELKVSTMTLENLPAVSMSSISPSLLQSMREKMESSAKMLPKLWADGSVWVGEGAKKVMDSTVWGSVGNGAKNVHRRVVDSSVWGKVGAQAGNVSKLVGERVGSATAGSPVWQKVGSGARVVADSSMKVGAGIGAGAKKVAQSPMWGTVGSGAKTGAKLVADSSMRVGAGIGAGAKKVAQSPVWGQVGSGAKAGAKMVAESPVWEKLGETAKKVPKVVIGGALLGLVLGVFLGGAIGGAVGATAGSVLTEAGRRKFTSKTTSDDVGDVTNDLQRTASNSVDSLVKQGEKILKTE